MLISKWRLLRKIFSEKSYMDSFKYFKNDHVSSTWRVWMISRRFFKKFCGYNFWHICGWGTESVSVTSMTKHTVVWNSKASALNGSNKIFYDPWKYFYSWDIWIIPIHSKVLNCNNSLARWPVDKCVLAI